VFFWPITVDLLRGPTPWDPALSSPQSFYRHTTSGLIRRVRPTVPGAVDSPGRSRAELVPEWLGRSAPCLADAWQGGRPGSGEPRQRTIWPQRIGAARVVFWPITVDLLRGPTPPDPALNSPQSFYRHTTSGLIRRVRPTVPGLWDPPGRSRTGLRSEMVGAIGAMSRRRLTKRPGWERRATATIYLAATHRGCPGGVLADHG
jgi:hypothetical protein